MTAALYAARNDYRATVIEKTAFGGQIADSPKVQNFPTIKSISGLEWSSAFFDQILDLGVNCESDEILSVEKVEDHFVARGELASYEADSVILATGVKHRRLGIENEERFLGKGVSYCAVCDGPFYKNKRTMVIGDANSALQYALLLAKTSSHLDVVTMFDKFFADKPLVDALKTFSNVCVTHNATSTSFIGDDRLKAVRFRNPNGEEFDIETDGCFVAIGQVPDNDRFKNLVDLSKGFIVTDDAMETKTPGVFAAGDCRVKSIRQLTTACNDGAIAALSAIKYLSAQRS